ncbi:DUF2569 family protein [Photorhabdus bodei]|uniref:DUF2569 family protein n=1 Tax=Photorhabdus bodei TaxID=2029681 RepID=UPI003981B614|nr:DUF2569 family protein [Photorhabdus bodei]
MCPVSNYQTGGDAEVKAKPFVIDKRDVHLIFGVALYTSVLFFFLKKRIHLFYIILLVFTSLFVITDLALAHYLYEIKLDYNYLFLLFRTVFYTCIWMPYFIIYIRVKRTFIK